jgi:hypothetical protein
MVLVTIVTDPPEPADAQATVVPLDAGRWALVSGLDPVQRRRVAYELRLLARRGATLRSGSALPTG